EVGASGSPASCVASVSARHSHSTGLTTMSGCSLVNAAACFLTASMVPCSSPGRQPSTVMVTLPLLLLSPLSSSPHAARNETEASEAMVARAPYRRRRLIVMGFSWVLLGGSAEMGGVGGGSGQLEPGGRVRGKPSSFHGRAGQPDPGG